MGHSFFDIAFTPSVKAEQERFGSRAAYARVEERHRAPGATLSDDEAAFIAARDSFYLATRSETGWPYVQHRGGSAGFVRVIDRETIAWAELTGNRQYVSAGNVAADDRVAIIMVDYPRKRRLKILGHMRVLDPAAAPDPLSRLADADRAERVVTVRVAAFDWNCPQHITRRYTVAEMEPLIAPLRLRIRQLEAQLARADSGTPGQPAHLAGGMPPS